MYCYQHTSEGGRSRCGRGLGSGRGGRRVRTHSRRMEPLELWGHEGRGGARGRLADMGSGDIEKNVRRQV